MGVGLLRRFFFPLIVHVAFGEAKIAFIRGAPFGFERCLCGALRVVAGCSRGMFISVLF